MVQELRGQEAILDCVAAGMLALRDDHIMYANVTAQALTGIAVTDLMQLPLSRLVSPDCLPLLQRVYETAPPHQLDIVLLTASGTIQVRMATLPITVDGHPALLATLTDISQHKHELETLRHSEQQFRVLVEANPDVIVRRDLDLRYMYVSPTLRNYMGRSLEDMLGKTMQDMHLPAGEIQRVTQAIEEAVQSRQTVALETHLPRPDKIVHFDTRIVPELDDQGNVISTVLYSRDITGRKQAEEALRQSENRLRAILDNMPVMLDAFDRDYRALFWNRECERITGYSSAEILGRSDVFHMLYTEDERLRMLEEYSKTGDNFREREWTLIRKDGTRRTISWSNITEDIPIPGWAFWAVGVDVTERRRVEALLREQERLRIALDKEHETGELRRQMMETLHHEFRTPLAIIQTSAEMLERYLERLSQEKRRDYLLQIRLQISHMTTMLETISSIMELQYGKFTLAYETLDLIDVCARAIESIQRRENRGHRFEVQLHGNDFRVKGDFATLQHACEHVLLNAVRYSADHSTIRLVLHENAPEIQLQVVDEGIGIQSDEHKQIFEPFFRGSNVSYATGGIGLGLTLVKAVIERHRGSIVVQSAPEQGTTVTLQLPRMSK